MNTKSIVFGLTVALMLSASIAFAFIYYGGSDIAYQMSDFVILLSLIFLYLCFIGVDLLIPFFLWAKYDRGLSWLLLFLFLTPFAGPIYLLKRSKIHSIEKDLAKQDEKILKKKRVKIKNTYSYTYTYDPKNALDARKHAMTHHAYQTGGALAAGFFSLLSPLINTTPDENGIEVQECEGEVKFKGFLILTNRRLIFAENDYGKPSKVLYDLDTRDIDSLKMHGKYLVAEYESGEFEVEIKNPNAWIPKNNSYRNI